MPELDQIRPSAAARGVGRNQNRLFRSDRSERFTLAAATLQDASVTLNGTALRPETVERLPRLAGTPVSAGRLAFAPATITFVVISGAGNRNCH